MDTEPTKSTNCCRCLYPPLQILCTYLSTVFTVLLVFHLALGIVFYSSDLLLFFVRANWNFFVGMQWQSTTDSSMTKKRKYFISTFFKYWSKTNGGSSYEKSLCFVAPAMLLIWQRVVLFLIYPKNIFIPLVLSCSTGHYVIIWSGIITPTFWKP